MRPTNWKYRFYSNISGDAFDPNACHIWLGTKDKDGYGQLKVAGKMKRAHRLSYELKYGSIPKGKLVCHTCDNPSCVNHKHLFLGSPKDNTQDMIKKGRSGVIGFVKETNHFAKFTQTQVDSIRAEYAAGLKSQDKLAYEYGTSQSHISRIIRKEAWKP